MSLAQFMLLVRKRWAYVVVPMVLAILSVGLLSTLTPPTYTARASAYFSLPFGRSASDLAQGSNYTQQQLGSYADLATKPIVLDKVIAELSLRTTTTELARLISATVSPGSVIVDVDASASTPAAAALLANTVTSKLGQVVIGLSPKAANSQPTVDVVTVATAVPPKFQSSPNTRRNVLAAALGSLLLGLLLALARDRLDTRVRLDNNLAGDLGVLGAIAEDRQARVNPVVAMGGDHARSSRVRHEAFVRLRTSLRFIDVDNPAHVIVMTSSVSGEGKTSVALNLARVLAQDGQTVAIVDADLRRPKIANYLGLEQSIGLSDVLAGSVTLEQALRRWESNNLRVLTRGSAAPNPSELLGSQAMAGLVKRLRSDFDFVIIDTPPLLPVIDAAVVGAVADGVVLVVRHGRTTQHQLNRAKESIASVDARLLGIVYNRIPRPRRWSHKGQDYYDYESQDSRFDSLPTLRS